MYSLSKVAILLELLKAKTRKAFLDRSILCTNEGLFPQLQKDSLVVDVSSSVIDEILSSECDLSFEIGTSPKIEPDETDLVAQVGEALKLFIDLR